MKYGTWNLAVGNEAAVEKLVKAGYGALTARVLAGRGIDTPAAADALLSAQAPLIDPFEMKEMRQAASIIHSAIAQKLRIAVFGDYDVDGITATCLLTDCLQRLGADCIYHIPGRLEEGYGLNSGAILQLKEQGVSLIITVDCGITALEEAKLCAELGITLVITDHHECKSLLPCAAAVVDPHRPDRTYPHTDLSGVGIAFKLASALTGDQEAALRRYADLLCLGTIADVMPLRGENRRLVVEGLSAMQKPSRLGLRALMAACDCLGQPITASTIGYVLAPRINAAGRMEHAELAVELFLTDDPENAALLAQTLCRLNRERQETESKIYQEASQRLRANAPGTAIVLAGENWHQGVVGIVASRLSEEFCCPAFLISLTGDKGKASSRSYGGFNLFASLSRLSPLLEGYGGHELAAGFTIHRDNIDSFRTEICQQVAEFTASGESNTALQLDCAVNGTLLSIKNIEALSQLEPCGTCCPKPTFLLPEAIVDHVGVVGGGKHLRLRLHDRDGVGLNAIFFSAGSLSRRLKAGNRVDLAFQAQINEYHGTRSVQLCLIDLRPVSPSAYYDRFLTREPLSAEQIAALVPERSDVVDVWNYLRRAAPNGRSLHCQLTELCCGVAAFSKDRHSIRRTLPCIDILSELGFLAAHRSGSTMEIRLLPHPGHNPLENSSIYRTLQGLK